MNAVAARRLELASKLARDVQHEYNNVVNVTYGYTQLLVRAPEDEIANQMMSALDRAVLLTAGFTFLTREPTPPVPTLEVSRLLLEVQTLVNVFPKGKLSFDNSSLRLLDANKHPIFHLLVEMCLSLRGKDESPTEFAHEHGRSSGGRDVHISVTSGSSVWCDIPNAVNLMLMAESCDINAADEALYDALCDEFGGAWRMTEGGFQLVLPGLEAIEEEADVESNVGVLLVVADEARRASLVSALDGLSIVDLADSRVALDVFETNPDDFGVVVFDPVDAAISGRSFMLRIHSLRPQVKTLLIGGVDTPAISAESSSLEETPAVLRQLCSAETVAAAV